VAETRQDKELEELHLIVSEVYSKYTTMVLPRDVRTHTTERCWLLELSNTYRYRVLAACRIHSEKVCITCIHPKIGIDIWLRGCAWGRSGEGRQIWSTNWWKGQEHGVRRVLARWMRYDVIALDEVGYVPLAEIGPEFLFQVIAERAGRAASIVTLQTHHRE
jgi:hypothetical protein